MKPLESAVIVAVPESEVVVSSWRGRLDPAAARGVPAHVTVLYPFLPPAELDDAAVATLAEVVGTVPAFACTLARVRWFDDVVVWLDPDPSEPFRRLTAEVWRRFPQCSPYGGRHAELIPHLTIADHAPLPDMTVAERAIEPLLPIHVRVTQARLICGSVEPNSWRTVWELPLGPPVG